MNSQRKRLRICHCDVGKASKFEENIQLEKVRSFQTEAPCIIGPEFRHFGTLCESDLLAVYFSICAKPTFQILSNCLPRGSLNFDTFASRNIAPVH